MMAYGRLTLTERLHEIADTHLAVGGRRQDAQDPKARRVRQRRDRAFGGLSTADVLAYIPVQIAGCSAGAILANRMFGLQFLELSTKTRTGGGLWLAEVVATVGLLLVIFAVVRSGRASIAPFAVGAYIGGAYFWTASTSFANPAIVVGRMLSNTFAGIKPSSAPGFIVFQLVGLVLAVGIIKILYPDMDDVADAVVVPAAPRSAIEPALEHSG